MIKPFQTQIDKLNFIVEHWNEFRINPEQTVQLFKDTFKTEQFNIEDCLSLNVGFRSLLKCKDKSEELEEEMIASFPKYSGYFPMPLGDHECTPDITNFANTPERLELAQHCIEFLIEEQKSRLGAIEKANIPKSKMVINLDDFNLSKDGYKRYCENEIEYEHKLNSDFRVCVYQNDKGLQVVQVHGDYYYDVHLFQHEGKVTDTVLHGELFNYLKGE